jgi:hypothetical protein
MVKFYRLAHGLALRISDAGMRINSTILFNLGGNLELWADERSK